MKSLLQEVRFDLFASVMGMTGLGLAWRFSSDVFELPSVIGEVIIGVAFLLFIVLLILQFLRLLVVPSSIADEWQNPQRFVFFPAATIAGSLLAIAVLPYSRGLAECIWLPTVSVQIILLTMTMRRWILESTQLQHVGPAWLIPMVGNASPSFAGVPLGYAEFSHVLLISALACWVLFTPIILFRIILSEPKMHPQAMPGIAILVSAPAVISIGQFCIVGYADELMQFMACTALFFAVTVFSLGKKLVAAPFSRTWWGFTFPASALASSLLRVYVTKQGVFNAVLAGGALIIATLVVLTVTILAVKNIICRCNECLFNKPDVSIQPGNQA